MSNVEDIVKSQSEMIGKLKEVKSNMGKKRNEQVLSVEDVSDIIRSDVLNGDDKKVIANRHRLKIGRVVEAMRFLQRDSAFMEEKNKQKSKSTDKDMLSKEYDSGKFTMEELAEKYAISVPRVYQICYEKLGKDRIKQIKMQNQGYRRISDDDKINIAADYDTCKYTMKELADKYSISYKKTQTIITEVLGKDRIKEIRITKMQSNKADAEPEVAKVPEENTTKETTENTSVKEEEKEEAIIPTLPPELEAEILRKQKESQRNVTVKKSYTPHTIAPESSELKPLIDENNKILKENITVLDDNTGYLEVGLIGGRHDMGVTQFIFNKISNEDIFEFTALENRVKKWIKSNIAFKDKVATRGLLVRVSGLQTAIMALAKVCYNMKVNLTIAHYQIMGSTKAIYRHQVIYDDFPMKNTVPNILSHIVGPVDKGYLYKSSADEYADVDEFYTIYVVEKSSKCRGSKNADSIKPLRQSIIIAKTFQDAMEANFALVSQYNDPTELYREISLNKYVVDDNTSLGYSSINMHKYQC